MKYLRYVLILIHAVFWIGAMIMGIGNMPSGFGACFLLMALFLTPQGVLVWLWEYWQVRAVLLAGLLYYMTRYIPMEDVEKAAENFIRFIQNFAKLFG